MSLYMRWLLRTLLIPMNTKNAKELLSMKDIDGGLIGGASLKTADFSELVSDAQ
jgi:triosephosphate isomerase